MAKKGRNNDCGFEKRKDNIISKGTVQWKTKLVVQRKFIVTFITRWHNILRLFGKDI